MAAENQKLSKTQKNQIFLLIGEAGLNPLDFAWREFVYTQGNELGMVSDYECDGIFRNEEFYFKFCRSEGAFGYYPEFCPGGISRTARKERLNWPQVLDTAEEWLSLLKSELEEPDFWTQAMSYITPLGIATDPVRRFTDGEVENLVNLLQDLQEKLTSVLKLDGQQSELLTDQIEYLVKEARTQSIKNWVFLFVGVMANCVLTLPITPDKVPLFWHVVLSILGPAKTLLGLN